MRKAAIVALLLSGLALAGGRVFDRSQEIRARRSDRGQVWLYPEVADAGGGTTPDGGGWFNFANLNGTGIGAVCAGADVTGANGEPVTFTRNSVAYCEAGPTVTGITNGSIVEVAVDKPRIGYGTDGGGGLKIGMFEGQTNLTLRSQEFDNATWVKSYCVSAAFIPPVTANYAVAPDGTTTAERIIFPATTIPECSVFYQATGCPGSSQTISQAIYVKLNSGTTADGGYLRDDGGVALPDGGSQAPTNTFDVCIGTAVALQYTCYTGTVNAVSWTRVMQENIVGSASVGGQIAWWGHFGNASVGPLQVYGARDMAAGDMLIWQADCAVTGASGVIQGRGLGPPIKTAGTTVARIAENAYATLDGGPKATAAYSMAATISTRNVGQGVSSKFTALSLSSDAGINSNPTSGMLGVGSTTVPSVRCSSTNSAGAAKFAHYGWTGAFEATRMSCYSDGTDEQGFFGGAAMTTDGGSNAAPNATNLFLGCNGVAGNELNGWLGNVCFQGATGVGCR